MPVTFQLFEYDDAVLRHEVDANALDDGLDHRQALSALRDLPLTAMREGRLGCAAFCFNRAGSGRPLQFYTPLRWPNNRLYRPNSTLPRKPRVIVVRDQAQFI